MSALQQELIVISADSADTITFTVTDDVGTNKFSVNAPIASKKQGLKTFLQKKLIQNIISKTNELEISVAENIVRFKFNFNEACSVVVFAAANAKKSNE